MWTKYQLAHPRNKVEKVNSKHYIYHENYGRKPNSVFPLDNDFILATSVLISLVCLLFYFVPADDILSNYETKPKAPPHALIEAKHYHKNTFVNKIKREADLYPQRYPIRREADIYPDRYPIIMYWTETAASDVRTCGNITCNILERSLHRKLTHNVSAYIFYASQMRYNDLPLPRKASDIWALLHDESPRNVFALYNDDVMRLFNYSSTISRYSDQPFPLQQMKSVENLRSVKYFVNTSDKNILLKDLAPILYIQSGCDSTTDRDNYVTKLMEYIKVDSYGRCVNNKKLPDKYKYKGDYYNNLFEPEFLKFVAQYKFTIAIENGICNDYITEKFWRPITVGSVPIYFGSPGIRDWLPNNKSAILIEDYPTPLLMANYIKSLLDNDTLYEEHLEHKVKGLVSNHFLMAEIMKHPYQFDVITSNRKFECFLCKKVHDKINRLLVPRTINRRHYDCPIQTSALTLKPNPQSFWVSQAIHMKEFNFTNSKNIYNDIKQFYREM